MQLHALFRHFTESISDSAYCDRSYHMVHLCRHTCVTPSNTVLDRYLGSSREWQIEGLLLNYFALVYKIPARYCKQ